MHFLAHTQLNDLLHLLVKRGYECVGPQIRDGAIMFEALTDAKDLPWGVKDIQKPGSYRLQHTGSKKAFAFANGPQAIKPFLFKPRESVFTVERNKEGKLTFNSVVPKSKPVALIGVRACDLAGMDIQDKVFMQGQYHDKRYQSYRASLFIISVNCSYSGNNCFCVSTNTGPKAHSLFDLSLTELEDGFVVDVSSDQGRSLIQALECRQAHSDEIQQAEKNIEHAKNMQTKKMPKNNSRQLRDILLDNLDHERWDNVAERCLSCGNCTSVCPTCFCYHETEIPALDRISSVHLREWDSCFTSGHSYIHNKVIRSDTKSQYKQWLTHKVGTWWDQFDTSGCIGCGRCITWCPVGIDITEEIAALSGDSNEVSDKEKE